MSSPVRQRAPDEPPDRYPLGAPIRPEPDNDIDDERHWHALDPAKPWLQTHARTGRMRNIKPRPIG